jgi:Tol biopolymer transport system component
VTPLALDTSNWTQARIAPDGRRVAVVIRNDAQTDIWVADLDRSTTTRLTSDQSSNQPVWTPDGQRIVYASHRDPTAGRNLYWQRVDKVGDAQRLTRSPNDQSPVSFHPKGRLLTLAESRQSSAILVLRIDGDEASGWQPAAPIVFLDGPEHEMAPTFSPDGHWLAYQSSASGTEEVHITPYPGPGGRRVVSTGGGSGPRWSARRPELIYAAVDHLNVIKFKFQHDALLFESPRPWPNAPLARNLTNASFFDVHPDGDRVLINGPAASTTNEGPLLADFVLHFIEELRDLPTSRRQ